MLEVTSVRSKSEFYAASKRMLLGNRLQQWGWNEFLVLSPNQLPQLVSLRTTRPASLKAQRYRIKPRWMLHLGQDLLKQGFQPDELLVDESAPDHYVQLQAEIMNTTRFWYMRYALASGVGMRQAYEHMQHVEGIRAVCILRQFLDGSSMDCVERLLQQYPDAVIELSSYLCKVGVLGWDTLIWEVREGY